MFKVKERPADLRSQVCLSNCLVSSASHPYDAVITCRSQSIITSSLSSAQPCRPQHGHHFPPVWHCEGKLRALLESLFRSSALGTTFAQYILRCLRAWHHLCWTVIWSEERTPEQEKIGSEQTRACCSMASHYLCVIQLLITYARWMPYSSNVYRNYFASLFPAYAQRRLCFYSCTRVCSYSERPYHCTLLHLTESKSNFCLA